MRFLLAVMADLHAVVAADAAEMAAIDAFNDRLEAAGQRVIALGVAGPDTAVVFDHRGTSATASAGPLVDVDDFMNGFWVIEVDDEATAHALAAEASHACNRRIEVRPIL